jgi:hypothetical protein
MFVAGFNSMKKLSDGGGLIASRLLGALEFESHEGLLLPLRHGLHKPSL